MNQNGNKLRAFIAVPLSSGLRDQLSRLARRLASQLQGVRWVEPENYHLTLRFLGDVPISQLEQLISALEGERWPDAFPLSPGGIGGFPSLKRARVIHVKASNPRLEALYAQLARVLDREGFPSEKRFSGHITLGRAHRGNRVDLRQVAEADKEYSLLSQEVERMALFKSELGSSGPIYEELGSFSLDLPGQMRS